MSFLRSAVSLTRRGQLPRRGTRAMHLGALLGRPSIMPLASVSIPIVQSKLHDTQHKEKQYYRYRYSHPVRSVTGTPSHVMDWNDSIGFFHDLGEGGDATSGAGHLERNLGAYHVTEAGEFESQENIEKKAFCVEYGIAPRDYRAIDPQLPYDQPVLLARHNLILFNFVIASGVITANSVTLMKPEDQMRIEVVERLARRLFRHTQERKSLPKQPPFEFAALENVLLEFCSYLRLSLRDQSLLADTLVTQLTRNIHDFDLIERVTPTTSDIVEMETSVNQAKKTLTDMLNNDEDMASLYLSEKFKTGKKRKSEEHEEIELLLEPYLAEMDRIFWEFRGLKKRIKSAVDSVTLRLDGERNYVMRLSLRINLAMAAMTPGVGIAGLFGMNLLSNIEDHPSAFYIASGSIVGGSVGLFAGLLVWARSRGL